MAEQYNLDRLEELRDRHRLVLAEYRRAGAAVQEAVKSLSLLRTAAASIDMPPAAAAAAAAMAKSPWPTPVMRNKTRAALPDAHLPPRIVQQIKAAEIRLARLTAERDKLTNRTRQLTIFSTKLELFAKAKNL